ncbi:uncharacterized protein [Physcomitrium patens]|uniref:uncharacterized protein isoform X6 n=1 Tax=Physcomitrium patens TaxID=3218 RepID=UPI003CCCF285
MPLYRIVGHAGLSGSSVEVCTDGKFRLHWSKERASGLLSRIVWKNSESVIEVYVFVHSSGLVQSGTFLCTVEASPSRLQVSSFGGQNTTR